MATPCALRQFRSVHLTLIGALRSLNRIQARSDFYRSWEVALRAKEDIGQSIAAMEDPPTEELLAARDFLLDGIGKGRPIGVVAKLRPDLFPPVDQALIASGESFGTLHDSLRLLSEYYLRDFTRMTRIRSWVGVPLFLAVAAAFVLPLPLLFDDNRWAYSLSIIGAVVGIYLLGGIPVSLLYSLGQGMSRVKRPRFAFTLAIGLEGGLTFAASARLAAVMGQMPSVVKHLDAIQPKAIKAMSLTKMVEGSGLWPAMQSQIAKADEASEYLSTLRVFAEHLESPP
jgi:type II secretory pathway component PulF